MSWDYRRTELLKTGAMLVDHMDVTATAQGWPAEQGLLAAAHEADVDASIAHAAALLERGSALAERLQAAGNDEDACGVVAATAWIAGARHPGVHASERLEAVLKHAGTRLAAAPAPQERPRLAAVALEDSSTLTAPVALSAASETAAVRPLNRVTLPDADAAGVRRVLHVVTETYAVGGHTRVLWRWISRDRNRRHAVVATAQRRPLPDGLRAAVQAAGGDVHALNPDAPILERAATLRAAARAADIVVLHIHPHDPVPSIALSDSRTPPVVMFNHGDHLFFLGAAVANAMHNVRHAGATIAERRGVDAARNTLAPFPVAGGDGQTQAVARHEARTVVLRDCNWADDTILLLTAAAPYKFNGPRGTTLLELIKPILGEDKRVKLLAVGAAGPAWEAAVSRGSVAVIPSQPSLAHLFAAADIYLESRPYGGPATSAEAAAHGLPVLTCATDELEAGLFCTDPRYGAEVLIGTDAYRRRLRSLIARPDARGIAGAKARATVSAIDSQWDDAVDSSYALAVRTRGSGHQLRRSESFAALVAITDEQLAAARAGQPIPEPVKPHDDLDRLVAYASMVHMPVPAADAERMVTLLENASSDPALRMLFDSLGEVPVGLKRAVRTTFAAPGANPQVLNAMIESFARLHHAGACQAFVLALHPSDADAAVPVLEAAIDAVPGLDVDLVLDNDPASVCPQGALVLGAA